MQNRPYNYNNWIYEEIILPENFPIIINDLYSNTIPYYNRQPTIEKKQLLHAHNCMELGYCNANSGVFLVNNKIIPYKSGDVSVFPKNTFHILNSTNRNDWVFISLDPIKIIGEKYRNDFDFVDVNYEDFKHIFSQDNNPIICDSIKKLIDELTNKNPCYKRLTQLLVHEILILIGRTTKRSNIATTVTDENDLYKITNALRFISQNYFLKTSVPALARMCNLSETHFRRIFKQHFSISPLEYLSKYRISMAKVLLLDTKETILSISLDVGFSSISSFNRQFMKNTNKTPYEWRNHTTT